MSISRRSVLALLGAAPVAAPQALSMSAAKTLAALPAAASSGGLQQGLNQPCSAGMGLYDFTQALRRRRTHSSESANLAEHIASKKSWSGAFKAHVHSEEADMIAALEARWRDDEAFRNRLCDLLGIGP